MDFLKKMFEKKECSICGKESGLLGNRKLEDGNLCKECTSKLSPWYEERRHATVQVIKQHLMYRELNRKTLETIKPLRSFGEYHKIHFIYADGYAQCFMVSKTDDYISENADIIPSVRVKNCYLDVSEHSTELTRLNENKQRVSYDPPRFEYRYDFYVVLEVSLDFCDDIRFKLNKHPVRVEIERRRNWIEDPTKDVQYQHFANMYREIELILVDGMKCGMKAVEENNEKMKEFRDKMNEKMKQAREMKEKLYANQEQKEQETATSPNRPKFCPNCGAPASAGTFCRECGYKLVK